MRGHITSQAFRRHGPVGRVARKHHEIPGTPHRECRKTPGRGIQPSQEGRARDHVARGTQRKQSGEQAAAVRTVEQCDAPDFFRRAKPRGLPHHQPPHTVSNEVCGRVRILKNLLSQSGAERFQSGEARIFIPPDFRGGAGVFQFSRKGGPPPVVAPDAIHNPNLRTALQWHIGQPDCGE